MRIIGGTRRGRKLAAPQGSATRPTSDRVREAVFNALFSLGDPVTGATVADLFAGTGAYGLEALSRGAAHVTFVENGRAALAAVAANVKTLGLSAEATIVDRDVRRWLDHAPAVDLAFVDPPYEFDGWSDVLARLRADLVVIETARSVSPPAGWELVRERVYGGTVVQILRPAEICGDSS